VSLSWNVSGIQLAVDAGIGEEDASGARLVDQLQQPELTSSIIDCVVRIIAAFFFAPRLLRRIIHSRMMGFLEKDPAFIDDKDLEQRSVLRPLDSVAARCNT